MHWSLDTTFGEIASRKRAEESEENFARIRQACLKMLKSETMLKASVKHEGTMRTMDSEFLFKVQASLCFNGMVMIFPCLRMEADLIDCSGRS